MHKPASHHKTGRLQSNLSFRLMSLEFRLRDRLRPPVRILGAAGVQTGMTVVDFGCGPLASRGLQDSFVAKLGP